MKRLFIFFGLFLITIGTNKEDSKERSLTEISSDFKSVVNGNNEFAFDLYSQLKEQNGNLFFSPFSISSALAIAYGGAKGNTEKQMSQILHFPPNQAVFHEAISQVKSKFDNISGKKKIELNIVNCLWIQENYGFLNDFLAMAQENYGSTIEFASFMTSYDTIRNEINRYIEQKTKRKIKDALSPGALSAITRLVIVNAIYFKGDWASCFKKKYTEEKNFWISKDKSVTTEFMQQEHEFRYMESNYLKILELPYVGYDLCMIVILPKDVDGINQIEESLIAKELNSCLQDLRIYKVNVILPKFKVKSRFELEDTLSSMGMPDAFDANRADFSGMTQIKPLFIYAVAHTALVEVDEQGTVATSATSVHFGCAAEVEPPSTIFLADHPFVFLIRDIHTGTILFMGRLIDPREAYKTE